MSVRTLGQPVCSDRKGLTLLKLNFWCSMIFLVFSLHTLHSLLWLRLRDLNFTSPDPDLSWAAAGCCGWILSWRGAMISVIYQRSLPTIFLPNFHLHLKCQLLITSRQSGCSNKIKLNSYLCTGCNNCISLWPWGLHSTQKNVWYTKAEVEVSKKSTIVCKIYCDYPYL